MSIILQIVGCVHETELRVPYPGYRVTPFRSKQRRIRRIAAVSSQSGLRFREECSEAIDRREFGKVESIATRASSMPLQSLLLSDQHHWPAATRVPGAEAGSQHRQRLAYRPTGRVIRAIRGASKCVRSDKHLGTLAWKRKVGSTRPTH